MIHEQIMCEQIIDEVVVDEEHQSKINVQQTEIAVIAIMISSAGNVLSYKKL